jgi:hypothetical protein
MKRKDKFVVKSNAFTECRHGIPKTTRAKSCKKKDVEAAVKRSSPGDTILLPKGILRGWKKPIHVPHGVQIVGNSGLA